MQNNREQVQTELEHEVARLRDAALKSTDPLLVAKSVAASDSDVQELILARLSAGERLAEVFAFLAKSVTEVQVFSTSLFDFFQKRGFDGPNFSHRFQFHLLPILRYAHSAKRLAFLQMNVSNILRT